MKFKDSFFYNFSIALEHIYFKDLEKMTNLIYKVKKNKGRIFFIGNGGSSANCSHAVNDFRKIVNIECYSITDNVSELTARINDEGFDTVFVEWLKTSKLSSNDAIFVLSVGGGNKEKSISVNIVKAVDYAMEKDCPIIAIVGKDGGYSYLNSTASTLVYSHDKNLATPTTEAMQSVILHYLVSTPKLKENETKWESVSE